MMLSNDLHWKTKPIMIKSKFLLFLFLSSRKLLENRYRKVTKNRQQKLDTKSTSKERMNDEIYHKQKFRPNPSKLHQEKWNPTPKWIKWVESKAWKVFPFPQNNNEIQESTFSFNLRSKLSLTSTGSPLHSSFVRCSFLS